MGRIYNGIKYFGSNDFSIEHALYDAEKILKELTPSAIFSDINNVIELYNIIIFHYPLTMGINKIYTFPSLKILRKSCVHIAISKIRLIE